MSQVQTLLNDLADIGATIRPAGSELILRAGPNAPVPAALVHRIRAAKSELLAMLSVCRRTEAKRRGGNDTPEAHVIEWLNRHPAPSQPGRCAWCGASETPAAVVVPFGIEPGKHAWLHSECWQAWSQARRAEAIAALKSLGTEDATPT